MRLRYRPLEPQDIPICLQLSKERARYGGLFDQLAPIWAELIRCESLIGAVVEDLDCPKREWVVAFGVSVFLTDAFVQYAKTPPLFWIGPELIRRFHQGCSPILNFKAIQKANSGGGLNLFIWQAAARQASGDDLHALSYELNRGVIELHRGYLIQEVLAQEASDEEVRHAVKAGGYWLNPSTGNYEDLPEAPEGKMTNRPFIVGITREMAVRNPGSWFASMLFHRTPPRIYFRPGEQRQLKAALAGGTDEELAERLDVSIHAVKKCWISIYQRVTERLPELFPENLDHVSARGARGTEKKHRLLSYLRDHPEELRPILPNGGKG